MEIISMNKAAKAVKMDKTRLRKMLMNSREAVESSRDNPDGFVLFPDENRRDWKIVKEKLEAWVSENLWVLEII